MIELSTEDTAHACELLTRLYDRRNQIHEQGIRIPRTFPREGLAWLEQHGLAPNQRRTLTHATAIATIVDARSRVSVEDGARAFLHGLGHGPPHGVLLEAVLLAHRMPSHRFTGPSDRDATCRVCGMPRSVVVDAAEQFLGWHTDGGGLPGDPAWAVHGLERLAAAPPPRRTRPEARARLAAILRAIASLPATARAKAAIDAVRGLDVLGPDPKGHRASAVVETLAFAGVLEAPPHHGLASGWVSAADRDRRPTMRTEVDAPLGFWRGANGVGWAHVRALFGLDERTAAKASAPTPAPTPPPRRRAPPIAPAPKTAKVLPRRPAEPGDVWAVRVREDAYVLVYVWEVEPGSRPLARTEFLDWFGATPPSPDTVASLGLRGRPDGRSHVRVHGLHKTSGTALVATAVPAPRDPRPQPDEGPHGAAKELPGLAEWCFPELDR